MPTRVRWTSLRRKSYYFLPNHSSHHRPDRCGWWIRHMVPHRIRTGFGVITQTSHQTCDILRSRKIASLVVKKKTFRWTEVERRRSDRK